MEELTLQMTGIVKEFPGVRALDGADFDLAPGEVHALLGINGAGKSTLIKVLSGVYQADAGRISLNGRDIKINSPQAALDHGIATVYQDPQMIGSFTGYENIFLGAESDSAGLFPRIRRRALRARASELLERFPVDIDLSRPVGELSAVEKESIAILRALSRENMSVLVLDEPTSILTRREIDVLFAQIRMLKERGISIIYITHRLDEVFEIADRLTVFRDGENVATCSTSDEGLDHARIAELMLDRELSNVYPPKGVAPGADVLSVRGLARAGGFDEVSFTAKRGWILGVFGLVGSGIDELCKTLFGVLGRTGGTTEINGRTVALKSPSDAIAAGLFLVPGDRRAEGQISDESVSFNVILSNMARVAGLGFLINRRAERRDAAAMVEELDIKTPDVAEDVSLLSGGNQQKVVIGKGLYTDCEVYVFQEPTVGVDVGAKAGIYEMIRKLSAEKAVIVVGSDCEEVYGLCDHAMVLHQGRVVMDKPASEVRLEQMLLSGLTGGEGQ
ncbi:MAG: sugar ABC transporter ATP-binding protein [Phycisphaerae bacterium]|nr:sugar ABC transporter ATP-binding protein [Phycisphaerae bacterium]